MSPGDGCKIGEGNIRNLEQSCPTPAPPAQLLPNLHNPLKIFAGLSKRLPVFSLR